MDNYSIVMPLKINNLNSYKIFTEISLPLYNKFLDTEHLYCFYIICPKENTENIRKNTNLYPSIPFKFIEEESIIEPYLNNEKGWLKQQIIKLWIANIIETKNYLVVDSDIYLVKPLKYEDLFHYNKIKYSFEEYQTANDKYHSTNSNWWINSCKILNYPIEKLYNNKFLMCVTPQLLITNKVKELINYINNIYGDNWKKVICNMGFTEYTLYWVYLLMIDQTNLYTTGGDQIWKHDLERNILYYQTEDEMRKIVKKSIIDKDTYFSVIQSYLPVNIDDVKNYLVSKDYDAIFLLASMTEPNRYQSFTREERVSQIIDCLKDIKSRVPNSLCIFTEGTILTEYERYEYSKYCILLELGKDETLLPYVNHPLNIGHGEMKLLERGIEYILNNNIFSKYVFKITPRYKLTDKFSLDNYKLDKYCFQNSYDNNIQQMVYITKLYSIPFNKLNNYKIILKKGQNILSVTCSMVEKLYNDMIKPEQVHLMDILGVEGNMSYNKEYFNI